MAREPSEADELRWDELSELLSEALALPESERPGFLHSRASDPAVIAEVLSLLAVPVPEVELSLVEFPEWMADPIDTLSAPPRLNADEVIDGRFRIERFLGHGGMGEVYAAVDQDLDVRVAVKILHPELSAEPSYISRFKREIGLAREITHPNVARVFDLGRELDHPTGPLYYLAMELLTGETLGARLRRTGPMDATEALAIARQIASGLQAAHAARIVHRDLKPSNIVLTAGRAVITDFGLAVPETRGEGSERSTTSLRLGTPGYVAPEHWAGKGVSAASDIYTFGIVLHEMVTGSHPNDPSARKLDGNWARVIAKCLELEPRNRWSSAQQAVKALEPRLFSRRAALGAAGALGVVGVGYPVWRYWLSGNVGRVTRILIAPVVNLTGDARLTGATALLQAQLDQSPQLLLVTAEERERGLERMGLAPEATPGAAQLRELAWRMNAPAVLHGTLALVGGYYVAAFILETMRGRPDAIAGKAERTFRANGRDDLIDQFRAAGAWVREVAGESAADIAENDRPPQEVSTASWEALAAYTRAFWTSRHGGTEEAAEQYLREALAADPGFVAAQQELADLYISRARFKDGYTHWQRAMELLSTRRVTFRERYRLETLYFEDTSQRAHLLASVHAWAIHYPNDEAAHFFHGSALFHAHRFDEALRSFETAWRLGRLARTTGYAAAAGWMKRDAAIVSHWLSELRALGDGSAYWKWAGQTAFLRGEYEEARAWFARLSGEGEATGRDQGFALLTCLFAETGRLDLANAQCMRHVEQARKWGRDAVLSRRLRQLAYLHLATGNPSAATLAIAEAAEKEQGPQASKDLATLYRIAGDRGGLRRLKEIGVEWPALPIFECARTWIAAEAVCLERGAAQAEDLFVRSAQFVSPYSWPALPVGTGLLSRLLPEHVPAVPAFWYLAQRHWPGIIRASGLHGQKVVQLDRFGRSLSL